MHPYTMLKELLESLGAELVAEDLRPDVFGSYAATYAREGNRVRLVWDGKDGWGFVQRHLPGDGWADATEFLTEGDLEGVPQNTDKITQFRQAVAQLLQSAA